MIGSVCLFMVLSGLPKFWTDLHGHFFFESKIVLDNGNRKDRDLEGETSYRWGAAQPWQRAVPSFRIIHFRRHI